ncbi:hypothetical protein [Desulfovibrio inopinatus]|nr:hypothetical protein [Desulfovibrio inopinatus]
MKEGGRDTVDVKSYAAVESFEALSERIFYNVLRIAGGNDA